MEKKKYDLCLEVLRRMKKEGVLDKIMIVGSWCVLLYEDYFKGKGVLPAIRTRDLEFLIPIPHDLDRKIDLHELVRDLGFIVDHKGEQGYITFQHPDLILEFLVPARGRETGKPYPVDHPGINAQPLRFMDLLAQDSIRLFFHDVEVTAPHCPRHPAGVRSSRIGRLLRRVWPCLKTGRISWSRGCGTPGAQCHGSGKTCADHVDGRVSMLYS